MNETYLDKKIYLFCTFDGEKRKDAAYVYKNGVYVLQAPLKQTKENLGKAICFSRTEKLGRFSMLPEYYDGYMIGDDAAPIELLIEAMDEAETYMTNIGCLGLCPKVIRKDGKTIIDSERDGTQVRFLMDLPETNAYSILGGALDGFPILFNAYPTGIGQFDDGNIVTIGYDKYALRHKSKSAIVWNIDRYVGAQIPPGYTLWGFTRCLKYNSKMHYNRLPCSLPTEKPACFWLYM